VKESLIPFECMGDPRCYCLFTVACKSFLLIPRKLPLIRMRRKQVHLSAKYYTFYDCRRRRVNLRGGNICERIFLFNFLFPIHFVTQAKKIIPRNLINCYRATSTSSSISLTHRFTSFSRRHCESKNNQNGLFNFPIFT
jgi:hypothetical protein